MTPQIKWLSLVLIILISIVAITQWQSTPTTTDNPLFNFNQDQVQSFQVNSFTNGLLFKKENGHWMIKKIVPPLAQEIESKEGTDLFADDKEFSVASAQEVSKALTHLMTQKNLKPISLKEKTPDTYKINEHSLHVVLYNKDKIELDRIYIGKSGPDPMTSFIKKKNSPHVFLANQDFNLLFFRTKSDWIKPLKLP